MATRSRRRERPDACERLVGRWLRRHYGSVSSHDPYRFPDFRVGDRYGVEVTGLYELESDGETSVATTQTRVHDILASDLSAVPFHSSYGPCFLSVEYGLVQPPNRRVLLRQFRDALAPYAGPGQPISPNPFLRLPCGVSLGLLPRAPGSDAPPLTIGLEMPYEGCIPDEELGRAMARALRRKTQKADFWKSQNPDFECWLVFVDRIGTILFADTRANVLATWRAALDVPPVWDRIVFFVMGDPDRPAAELLARRGPYADMSP